MKIITYPNKILEKKAKKIKDPLDAEIQKLIKKMIETLQTAEGAGLAAPQVGKSIRLCIVRYEENTYILINPQITSYSRATITREEGCLSFPGKFIPIKRAEKIKARYTDEKGNKIKTKAEGLFARIIQHEIDHLNGILFIKRAKK
ncbi:MAG: peptide deformylase [bacterium]|nr:peptide deformylase [bacterium]